MKRIWKVIRELYSHSPIPWDKIRALEERSCALKVKGDVAAMIAVQEEVARLLEADSAGAEEAAMAWNYVADLNFQLGNDEAAERAARRSVSLCKEHLPDMDNCLGLFLRTLSLALKRQGRFSEATQYAEEALRHDALWQADEQVIAARRTLEKYVRDQIRKG